jgi:hypothetical protein
MSLKARFKYTNALLFSDMPLPAEGFTMPSNISLAASIPVGAVAL